MILEPMRYSRNSDGAGGGRRDRLSFVWRALQLTTAELPLAHDHNIARTEA